jgi:hypothetical protein
VIHPTGEDTRNRRAAPATVSAVHEHGWYLYGITKVSPDRTRPAQDRVAELDVVAAPLDLGPDHARVSLLERGSLAAVVRQVSLADFTPDVLQARLGDPAMLRLAVQMHNDVIGAVHQRWAILPARFGAVYARLEEIASAIDHRADMLLAQLARLDGCDEWAVHIYVDQRIVRESIRADQARGFAHEQLASAGPGRAYFLRRRLDDDLAARTTRATEEIALAAYQQIAESASDAQASWTASPAADVDDDVEVLRAAVLVHRERSTDFVASARAAATDGRAWRCTLSGPWPPYSFASLPDPDGHDEDRHDGERHDSEAHEGDGDVRQDA